MPTLILATMFVAQAQAAADGGGLSTLLTAIAGFLTTIGGIGGTMAWQRRRQAPEPQAMDEEHSHPHPPGCANTDAIKANAEAVGTITHTLDRMTDVVGGISTQVREGQAANMAKLDEMNIRLVKIGARLKLDDD